MFAKEHDDEENMFDICIKVEDFVLFIFLIIYRCSNTDNSSVHHRNISVHRNSVVKTIRDYCMK